MKQLVLPTASKSWCLTAYSDSYFYLQFGSLPMRQHSMAYSRLRSLLSALMSFWLKGSYEQTVRWAATDKQMNRIMLIALKWRRSAEQRKKEKK